MSTVKSCLQVWPGAAPTALVLVRPTSPLLEQGSGRHTSPVLDAARRTYSDIAASRPTSPVGNSEEEARSPQPPSHNVGQGKRQSNFISRIPIASPVVNNKDNADNLEPSNSENNENTNEWTMVQRKHYSKKHVTSKERLGHCDASAAVDSVIVEAEKSLTTAQKKIIALRQKKVNITSPDKSVPHEGGHSGSKGKGIDPRNWGNIHLSEDKTNVEVQQVALNSFQSNNIQFEHDEPPHAAVTQSEPEGRRESMA